MEIQHASILFYLSIPTPHGIEGNTSHTPRRFHAVAQLPTIVATVERTAIRLSDLSTALNLQH